MPLYQDIILKSTDVQETHPIKVYFINNDPKHFGLELAVSNFHDYIHFETEKRNSSGTSNGGLRLACIMLDSQRHGPVCGILTRKLSQR